MLKKNLLFSLILSLGFLCSIGSNAVSAQTCTATYAKWDDWTVSSDGNFNLWDDLQFGQSNGKGSAGLPPFLGNALSSSFMGRSGNKTYYFSYHETNPTIEYLDNWGGQERLFYLVDYVYIRYPQGSSIPPTPSSYGFVSSTCPEDMIVVTVLYINNFLHRTASDRTACGRHPTPFLPFRSMD